MIEYSEIVAQSQEGMDEALSALDALAKAGAECPPATIQAYQEEVDDIEVGSVRVRAQAKAILARRDAYFDTWERLVTESQGAGAGQLAKQRRPAMLDSFHRIETLSAQTEETFDRFLSGLQTVRDAVEQDPHGLGAGENRAAVASTQAGGLQVKQDLEALQGELDGLIAMMKAVTSSANAK